MKNLLVAMSGGTTTVINATLAGLISKNKELKLFNKILVGIPGITGFLNENILDITNTSENKLNLMQFTPGSALTGTTRIKTLSDDELSSLGNKFLKYGIHGFVNIGGNGTIKQTKAIRNYIGDHIKVAAAPKTVDNDLGDSDCLDVLFTPGFPSCVNHWAKIATLLDIENEGSASHDKALVAQTFGRETGFLAGAIRVIDPLRKLPIAILLPEDQRPINEVIRYIDKLISKHGRAMVYISEGYDLGVLGTVHDATGQIMYGSSKSTSAQLLVDELIEKNIQARSYIPTVLQRQAIDDTLSIDRIVAFKQGCLIIKQFAEGNDSFLATIKKIISYKLEDSIDTIEFKNFNDYSRILKDEFIDKGKFDVSDAYLHYLNGILKLQSDSSLNYGYKDNTFLRSFS